MNILTPLRIRNPDDSPRGAPDLRIEGGRTLIGGEFVDTTVTVAGRQIDAVGRDGGTAHRIDADGLLVLPGIVDIHGDAFERQMMPRPGVGFPLDIALIESDRQAIANGITTVFHGVTWSWEPGLRGSENARAVLAGIERLRGRLGADTRYHLRHETYNLDAENEVVGWMESGRIDALAFNDHMTPTLTDKRPHKVSQMAERAGLTREAFDALLRRVERRGADVPGSIKRLAAAARRHGVPLLSHDDTSPAQRDFYRALGCRVAEFPTNEETAGWAVAAGDLLMLGAPNVVRGGSHTGWTDATEMVRRGWCAILASDYYYPAPLLAAFRLAEELGAASLAEAWRLIAQAPAAAVGLTDRGTIAAGQRADLVLVAGNNSYPEVIATIAAGRLVQLADASRLKY